MRMSRKIITLFIIQLSFIVMIILFLTCVRFVDPLTFETFTSKYQNLSEYDVSISLVYDGE